EAAQARLAGLPHVRRAAVDAEERAVRRAHVAELRGNDGPIASIAQRAADELPVAADAVHVGRVEEVDPDVQRAENVLYRERLSGRTVEVAHPHAAEPDGRHVRAVRSEFPRLHRFPPESFVSRQRLLSPPGSW